MSIPVRSCCSVKVSIKHHLFLLVHCLVKKTTNQPTKKSNFIHFQEYPIPDFLENTFGKKQLEKMPKFSMDYVLV